MEKRHTLGTKHMKAQDYKKEYETLNDSLGIIVARIEMRLISLCKRYPEVLLHESLASPHKIVYSKDMNFRVVSEMDTKTILKFIEAIEKHIENKRKNNHKTTSEII